MSQKGKGEERKRQGGKEAQGEEAVYEAVPLVGNMGARARREGELGARDSQYPFRSRAAHHRWDDALRQRVNGRSSTATTRTWAQKTEKQ
jgi:hypothetical protein